MHTIGKSLHKHMSNIKYTKKIKLVQWFGGDKPSPIANEKTPPLRQRHAMPTLLHDITLRGSTQIEIHYRQQASDEEESGDKRPFG